MTEIYEVIPGVSQNTWEVFSMLHSIEDCSKTCLSTVLIRSIFAREKVFPAQNVMN